MGSRFVAPLSTERCPVCIAILERRLPPGFLNRIYGSRYSDIHCGMRGLTRSALKQIDLKSQSWEYASEMVLKAARLKLVTAEVPVKFHGTAKAALVIIGGWAGFRRGSRAG